MALLMAGCASTPPAKPDTSDVEDVGVVAPSGGSGAQATKPAATAAAKSNGKGSPRAEVSGDMLFDIAAPDEEQENDIMAHIQGVTSPDERRYFTHYFATVRELVHIVKDSLADSELPRYADYAKRAETLNAAFKKVPPPERFKLAGDLMNKGIAGYVEGFRIMSTANSKEALRKAESAIEVGKANGSDSVDEMRAIVRKLYPPTKR